MLRSPCCLGGFDLVSNGAGFGERILVVAKNHDGVASAIFDARTREATPIKLRPSDNRQRIFLAPGAMYAVGWENLRDIKIYPKCGARAKVKHRHEDYGLQLLHFSPSGDCFAYVTDGWRAYEWRADGKEPAHRWDAIEGAQIRALAYDDEETLWVAAGDSLFRMDEKGAPTLHAEPGPVTRFVVDGDRFLAVVRGGLVTVPR